MSALPSFVQPPAVGKLRALKLPAIAERTLKSGLHVVVARKPGVPLVEARVAVPMCRGGDSGEPVRRRVLANALLSGTTKRTALQIAEDLQSMGASLHAGADADDLTLSGSVLSTQVAPFLDLVAEVISSPTFPEDEVTIERERTAQEVMLIRSQPAGLAQMALSKRLFGRHPYGGGLPTPEVVMRVTPAQLRAFHKERVVPKGSVLILVGDISPQRGLDLVEAAFSDWKGRGAAVGLPPVAELKSGPVHVVHREGSVQSSIRVARFGLEPKDENYARLLVANLIFGGYFGARLSVNIREDKGYTYGIYSLMQAQRHAAILAVATDVATDVTLPTLVELHYEMGKMVALPPTADELDAVKKYQAGTLAMSVNTQASLASQLLGVVKRGQSFEFLKELPTLVQKVTAEEVHDIAARFLAPPSYATVIVGDANAVLPRLEPYLPAKVVEAG